MDSELLFSNPSTPQQRKSADLAPSPWKILIVDDEPDIHAATRLALDNFEYQQRPIQFFSAYSAEEARQILIQQPQIALAFIDVVMETEHAGLELVNWVRSELGRQNLRIILRTGQPGQAPEREVIERYQINDYKEKSELTSRKLYSATITGLRSYEDINTIKLLFDNLNASQAATVQAVATLCESRDRFLGSHIQRVATMARSIAVQLAGIDSSIDQRFINDIALAATLHDTGKVSISDTILNAPRRLNEHEMEIIRQHPSIGRQALEKAQQYSDSDRTLLAMAQRVAYSHHERWDGSGYPEGLMGEAIPLEARIVAIADTFDALRAQRPYKPSFSFAHSMQIMYEGRGRHFDPRLFDLFQEIAQTVDNSLSYESFEPEQGL